MRFVDGPDEVHLRVIAREELKKAKSRIGSNLDHFIPPASNGTIKG